MQEFEQIAAYFHYNYLQHAGAKSTGRICHQREKLVESFVQCCLGTMEMLALQSGIQERTIVK